MEHQAPSTAIAQNIWWLSALVVLLVVPGYFLVIGRDTEPFDRAWFLDVAERARYGVVLRRMLVWFSSTGAVGLLWSVLFDRLFGGS